jgi:GT2 family glycosyltransferase
VNETLTIIVPYHLEENKKYLDECLASIFSQDLNGFVEVKVVLVADTPSKPETKYPAIIVRDESLNTFAKKINYAIKEYPAKYYLIASDDVVLSKGSIMAMVRASWILPSIVNCDSNCEDINIVRIPGLGSNSDSLIIRAIRLKFYSTLIPHAVVEKVGLLDEKYKNGWEDTDYCIRCRLNGITPIITMSGFIYHHGGKTVDKEPKSTDNEAYYLEKWKDSYLKFIAYL